MSAVTRRVRQRHACIPGQLDLLADPDEPARPPCAHPDEIHHHCPRCCAPPVRCDVQRGDPAALAHFGIESGSCWCSPGCGCRTCRACRYNRGETADERTPPVHDDTDDDGRCPSCDGSDITSPRTPTTADASSAATSAATAASTGAPSAPTTDTPPPGPRPPIRARRGPFCVGGQTPPGPCGTVSGRPPTASARRAARPHRRRSRPVRARSSRSARDCRARSRTPSGRCENGSSAARRCAAADAST